MLMLLKKQAKKTRKVAKKVLVSFTIIATLLMLGGSFLIGPRIALAQDSSPPGMDHWSIWQIDGDAAATTTVSVFVFAGDDQARPGGTPELTVTAFYQNAGWSTWKASSCTAQYTDSHLFKCDLEVGADADNSDGRIFKYYLRAHDGENAFFLSWGSDNTATSTAQTYPFEATVYNSPSWSNAISGAYSSSSQWPGVKDGRCTTLTAAVPIATSTVYVDEAMARSNGLGMTPDDWILLGGDEKFRIVATSTQGTNLALTLSGYTTQGYPLGDCINEFVAGATVWIDGTTIFATSSDVSATSTFGTFTLYNVPDGTWDVVAFKKNYMDIRQTGISLFDTATTTIDFYLPYGTYEGGGDLQGTWVTWSAPFEGAMDAPIDISITAFPILIGLSENASSTTVTSSNVLLKQVNPDGTTTNVSDYSVAYEPMNQNVIIDSTEYDFGNDAKIIIYSTTKLATSTSYIVRVTSDVKDANNAPIEGNDPAGGHTIFFNTMGGDFAGGISGEEFGMGGAFMPPFVMNVIPTFGSFNVPPNTKIAIEFDQPMDSTSFSGNIELWKLDASYNQTSHVAFTAGLSQTDSSIIILTPSANLTQGRYRVNLKGGLRSSSGITMAPPGQEGVQMFNFEFEVGASDDTVPPTVLGTSLDRYQNAAGNYVNVPTSGVLKIAFSEPIDPESINNSNIYLRRKGSTINITGTGEYDIMEGKALFIPSSALNASSTYILTLTAGIKDFTTGAGNRLATTTYEFTTGGIDTASPRLEFFNADDYHMDLVFSEPMNAAAVTDTSRWPSGRTKWETSVLNPKNYVVYVDNGPPPTGSTAKYFGGDSLASSTGITLSYDALYKTVEIEGLKLMADPSGIAGGVRVWVNNVTDISGNEIQDSNLIVPPNNFGANSGGGPVFNSMDTFGMMGPGAGGMMGPPPSAGEFTITDFGGKNPAMMGMVPVGVWPMNTMAGATSIYMIDIPISSGKAIPPSGKIVIGPFPDESDVSGAKNADPNGSFAHYDINGPGPGKVVIDTTTAESSGGLNNDGVTVSGQLVTINLGSVGTAAPDFLHLELDGIRNPTTPTQGGYSLNIQTQDSSGRLLESFTSMPFFIMPKGKYTIIGHATSTSVGLNGVDIFGGSPSTGPLFVTTSNNAFGSSTDGEFKIEGLNAGDVMLMTEPFIQVGSDEYIAPMPEPIFLDDTTTANSPSEAMAGMTGCTSATSCYYYKKFTLTKVSSADTPGLTVEIVGDFSANGVGTTEMDIFAGGPNGFRVKTVTLDQDYSSTPYSTTLNLPTIGDYHIGIGPAMPKGPMGMAAPPMPDKWMPPPPIDVSVSGSDGNWTWVENSQTPNDGTVKFFIELADKSISGTVLDPAGNPVQNAEVFAYSPTEFFGTGTHVNADGSFTLNVKAGFYKVGAFLPGAPPSGEIGVEVKTDGTVYVDGVLTTSVTLGLSKNIQTGYTISGTVYSDVDSRYPAADASVYAYRTDGPGHSETMTDSKGSYTLYVGAGTWKIGVYLPDYGDLNEVTLTVPPSKSGLKFAPAADVNYITIRERVWEDKNNNGIYDPGEGVARANVSVISTSTDYLNSAITDSNGVYEVKVPENTVYDVEVWSPELGDLPPQKNVAVGNSDIILTGAADVPIEHATTVEITFYDALGNATTVDKVLVQLDQTGSRGISNDVYKENVATTTIKVSTSTNPYILDIEIEGIPKQLLTMAAFDANTAFGSTTVGTTLFATTTVDGYEKIKITLPELSYVSGQVKDDSGNAVPNAILHIEQPGTDIEFDVETDSSGNFSFRVASSTSPYLIQANKAGYIDSAVAVYASTSAVTFNPVIEDATYTISGTITVDGSPPGETEVYVRAEKLGGGYASVPPVKVNLSTGAYSINVSNGDWEISAVAEGKTEATQTTIAQVSGSNVSGVNIDISAAKTLVKQETLGMTGNIGGSLVNKSSNFEMHIPRGTLSATDASTYNVKEKETSNVPPVTPTGNLVGDKAEDITAYKMSGSGGNVSTVSGLNGAAFVDKIFTKTELTNEGIDTVAEVEQTKMAIYDDTAQNWINLPTTITYLDSNEQPVIPSADLSNVDKVVFNAATKHFSKVGVVNTVYDGLAPSAPTNIRASSEVGRVKITWDAVTTNIDGTPATDIIGYNIYRSTIATDIGSWTKIGSVSGSGSTTFYDTTAQAAVTYYYRVTADTGLQSAFSGVSNGGGVLGAAAGGAVATGQAPAEEAPSEEAEEEVLVEQEEAPAEEEMPVEEEEEAPSEELVGIPTVSIEKPISEMTIEEIEAKIAEILAVISQLQELLKQVTVRYEGIPTDFSFTRNLKQGMKSNDVKYLQIILKAEIGSPTYPEDVPATGYFGPITKASVVAFQERYSQEILAPWGLTKGTGFVGSTTRQKLNKLLRR